MNQFVQVLRNRYADSVKLMRVSEQLRETDGVESASVVMGTPMNLSLLVDEGFEAVGAGPDDLVLALRLSRESGAQEAISVLEALLVARPEGHAQSEAIRTQPAAVDRHPEINLAVIAVPGEYAGIEAWQAIRAGLNVFIFSDNVSLEQEVKLKKAAAKDGLLVMGPDCGTSIIGGVGLGFANRVRRGSIGLIGASGTGIQQVSALIHEAGGGIAEAIGTGSRDLSADVGGRMTLQAIDRLASNPRIDRIGVISKPSDPMVASTVLLRLASCGKPAVACLLGYQPDDTTVALFPTLTALADALLHPSLESSVTNPPESWRAERAGAGTLTALYCGGTLCTEAERIAQSLGLATGTFVDVGDDRYTRGRAHPMIDQRLRNSMLAEAGEESDVLLFDIVLGDLSHKDPAGATLPGLEEGLRSGRDRGVAIQSFACLIGTELDPQGLSAQRVKLEGAGVHVFSSNEAAARAAVEAAFAGGSGV